MGVSSGLWLRERELRGMDKLRQRQVNLFIWHFLHQVFQFQVGNRAPQQRWHHHYPHTIPLTPSPSHHPPHTIPLTPSPSHHHPHTITLTPSPSHHRPHTITLTPSPSHHHPHTITLTPSPHLSSSPGKSACLHFVMSGIIGCTGRGA